MNIRKQIKDKINLGNLTNIENKNNILNNINDFILYIISIPFTFENNKHIIDNIFNKYENEIFNNFKIYYRNYWKLLVYKGVLNYYFQAKSKGVIVFSKTIIEELKLNYVS